MSSVGFEPTVSAGELPQTYALDRAATGTWKRFPGEVITAPAHCCWYVKTADASGEVKWRAIVDFTEMN